MLWVSGCHLRCSSAGISHYFLIRPAFPVMACNALKRLFTRGVKRSRCCIYASTPVHAQRKRPLWCCCYITLFCGPTFMHHRGSTLRLTCVMKSDYKREKWAKYFTFTEMLDTDKDLHIPPRKQLLIIKAFCLCMLLFLTKSRGSIHHPEWRGGGGGGAWMFTVLFSSRQSTVSADDLLFVIYDSLGLENKHVLHV